MSTRADVEELQITRTEKLLAAVLTAFLLIGGIWTYTRIDEMVPTRDGVRLYTQIFAPAATNEKYPFLLIRACRASVSICT